jgi:hypothetical protein
MGAGMAAWFPADIGSTDPVPEVMATDPVAEAVFDVGALRQDSGDHLVRQVAQLVLGGRAPDPHGFLLCVVALGSGQLTGDAPQH